jgi:hypothetical protein
MRSFALPAILTLRFASPSVLRGSAPQRLPWHLPGSQGSFTRVSVHRPGRSARQAQHYLANRSPWIPSRTSLQRQHGCRCHKASIALRPCWVQNFAQTLFYKYAKLSKRRPSPFFRSNTTEDVASRQPVRRRRNSPGLIEKEIARISGERSVTVASDAPPLYTSTPTKTRGQ